MKKRLIPALLFLAQTAYAGSLFDLDATKSVSVATEQAQKKTISSNATPAERTDIATSATLSSFLQSSGFGSDSPSSASNGNGKAKANVSTATNLSTMPFSGPLNNSSFANQEDTKLGNARAEMEAKYGALGALHTEKVDWKKSDSKGFVSMPNFIKDKIQGITNEAKSKMSSGRGLTEEQMVTASQIAAQSQQELLNPRANGHSSTNSGLSESEMFDRILEQAQTKMSNNTGQFATLSAEEINAFKKDLSSNQTNGDYKCLNANCSVFSGQKPQDRPTNEVVCLNSNCTVFNEKPSSESSYQAAMDAAAKAIAAQIKKGEDGLL